MTAILYILLGLAVYVAGTGSMIGLMLLLDYIRDLRPRPWWARVILGITTGLFILLLLLVAYSLGASIAS